MQIMMYTPKYTSVHNPLKFQAKLPAPRPRTKHCHYPRAPHTSSSYQPPLLPPGYTLAQPLRTQIHFCIFLLLILSLNSLSCKLNTGVPLLLFSPPSYLLIFMHLLGLYSFSHLVPRIPFSNVLTLILST